MTVGTAVPATDSSNTRPAHAWLRTLHLARLQGPATALSTEIADALMLCAAAHGHVVQDKPSDETDAIITTARFGEPLGWRQAPFFQARRQYGLRKSPTVFTVVHVRPGELAALTAHFERSLAKDPPDLADFAFPGLASTAHRTLIEQGRRGGPILAIERMMQTQAMCLRLVVVVGEERPDYAVHFDLVGSYPRSEGNSPAFYDDILLRLATSVSAHDVAKHLVVPPEIDHATWLSLHTPPAMRQASLEFAKRNFFTEMVRIADLNTVPALGDAIASQYSEGCFATWDPDLNAIVATTTGSARPVDKRNITDDELAVISGERPDEEGPAVQHVEGKRNDPPSSEAFEMIDMDRALPTVVLASEASGVSGGDQVQRAPVIRSKLHGHRGVSAYDPRHVEYAPMGLPYFWYPVTCGTLGQAIGVKEAFAQAEALQNPEDPRQVVFTILPGHGVFIVEKWVAGKAPFQLIWEYMDAGYMRIDTRVPQGPEFFAPAQLGSAVDIVRGE